MAAPGIFRVIRLRPLARAAIAVYALVVSTWIATTLLTGCRKETKVAVVAVAPKPGQLAGATSADCRRCHEEIFRVWTRSQHAHAHRPVDVAADADAFQPSREFARHGIEYRIAWEAGRPAFTEKRSGQATETYTADFVLGYSPLRQYIVPIGGGRYQAAELAFDPQKKEWFNVFGDEQRQPGEWGHWRGRGMNWNSMCAMCHLTEFQKNYDAATDTYASTWREHGVGCTQCHGGLPPEHGNVSRPAKPSSPSRALIERAAASAPRVEVQSAVSRADGQRWILRWETLGRNRDLPRAAAPPPTELWLYELPDAAANDAVRVGS